MEEFAEMTERDKQEVLACLNSIVRVFCNHEKPCDDKKDSWFERTLSNRNRKCYLWRKNGKVAALFLLEDCGNWLEIWATWFAVQDEDVRDRIRLQFASWYNEHIGKSAHKQFWWYL